MNLPALREAVRHTMRGESIDLTELDESSARAFATWKSQHSGELTNYEPPVSASANWVTDRSRRSEA